MQRTTMDLWVGVFVMAGIGALLVLALKVGNLGTYSEAESYTLIGNFENIGGLKVRAPVKSAGVVVGRITDIQFNTETYDAAVTMNIDRRYQFPRDTFASILTSGLLGEQYIGLAAGGDVRHQRAGQRDLGRIPEIGAAREHWRRQGAGECAVERVRIGQDLRLIARLLSRAAGAVPGGRVGCGVAGADAACVGEADPAEEDATEVKRHEEHEHEDRDDEGELDQALATTAPGTELTDSRNHARSIPGGTFHPT